MIEYKLNSYQDSFIFNDDYKFKFLKSGWATGKSLALILACVRQCDIYPNNLGIIYRKEAVDLRDSTIKQFEQVTGITVDSKRDATFPNGSVLMFRHSEDIFGTVQNVNLGFAGIEEHAELENPDLFYLLFGRLRRQGTGLKLFSVGNACGHNWVYQIKQSGLYPSDDKTQKRWDLHLEATTYENAHNLSKEYLDSLLILKQQKPAFYNRFVMNSDDEGDAVDQIINRADIEASIGRIISPRGVKKVVVCDPSRYGDDETVLICLQGNEEIDREIYGQKDTMDTAGRILRMRNKNNADGIAVDSIGIGAGIVDRLKELGESVIEINSASASMYPERFKNLRAEMWERAAEKFRNNQVSITDDKILIEQLASMRYKTVESSGVLQVEAKQDYKKRVGTSPDRADALVMGLWAIERTQLRRAIPIYSHLRDNYSRQMSWGY